MIFKNTEKQNKEINFYDDYQKIINTYNKIVSEPNNLYTNEVKEKEELARNFFLDEKKDESQEDVIKEALKKGFQSIVDEKMDGNYYTVRWDEAFHDLQVLGIDNELVGSAKPKADGPDFIKQFKINATNTWFVLDKDALAIIGR